MTELAPYLQDASQFRGEAERLLLPSSEQEIAQALREAQRTGTPVTVAGAGTGLTGGRVPQGGLVLSTEKLNRILEIQGGWARVQPAVTLKQLEEACAAQGLFYPPDPGEKAASLGGTIATNASGPRSLKYGATRLYVERLRIVLPDGVLLGISRGQVRENGGVLAIPLPGGKSREVPVPSYRQPDTKNSAGYFAEEGMDAVDLFVGAEGTLGVITEATLRLLKIPAAILSGLLFFDSERNCFAFAGESKRQLRPRALEFMDSRSLRMLSEKHSDIPKNAGAALLFEEECLPEDLDPLRKTWSRAAEKGKARPSDCWFSHKPEDQALFRKYRYALPVMVNERAAANKTQKLGTDFAVPEEAGEEMFDFYLEKVPSPGIEYAIWGHLGDQHLHVNLLPKTPDEFERAKELYGLLARKALELGGTVSAEHGIGKTRIPYLEWMVGRKGLLEMARVKKAFDPAGILNRGNIFPAELLKEV